MLNQTVQCTHCGASFIIYERDQDFYANIGVPEPEWCPPCRFQLINAYRNERTLYQRSCAMCAKPTVAMYSPDKPYIIYCRACWWSDKWDALEYGQEIDFTRPFFEQWAELRLQVPRIALLNDADSENSAFTNHVYRLKNCYIVSDACDNEGALYCNGIYNTKDCVDCSYVDEQSELCYQTMFSKQSYGLRYSRDCVNCRDSAWLIDCVGVSNSFMCVGLRNQEYHFQNRKLSPAEYQAKLAEYDLGSRSGVGRAQAEFAEFAKTVPRKYFHGARNEDSDGDYLHNNKSVHYAFQTWSCEQCSYVFGVHESKNCYDHMVWGEGSELVYQGQAVGGQAYKILFGNVIWHGQENTYCDNCLNGAQFNFGSISLKKHKYTILNQQYSGAEYKELSQKLIAHMQETGEWGGYFPKEYALFDYNESDAQEFFPRTKQRAVAEGWRWQDNPPGTQGQETITDIPDSIADVPDDFTKETLKCSECARNYKIVEAELAVYKNRTVPVPDKCPSCRRTARMRLRPQYRLNQRQCMCARQNHTHQGRCKNQFQTVYASDCPEQVYCEECYTLEVY